MTIIRKTKLMKPWINKKSTFYLRIGGTNAIPFVYEKEEKYRIDMYQGCYYADGVWNKISSEETDLEDIIIYFNGKHQKAVLNGIGESEKPIDVFICYWHEAIRGGNKLLLLNRIPEKEDEFEVIYMDFFLLHDMDIKILKVLLKDILPKMSNNTIPSSSNFFLEDLEEKYS